VMLDTARLTFHRDTRSVIGSAGFKGAPDASGMVEIDYGMERGPTP